MSFAKYLEGRRRSEAAVEKLAVAMSDLQIRMADQLVDLLLDLDVRNGKVESTDANINRVSQIMALLTAFIHARLIALVVRLHLQLCQHLRTLFFFAQLRGVFFRLLFC